MKLPTILAVALSAIGVRAAEPNPHQDAPKSQAQAPAAKFKNVSPQEFEKLRGDKQAVVLDVRTAKEYAAGHIPGATNIDINAPNFDKKISALDPKKTYLVHCAGGVRSAKACGRLSTLNFEHLYNLEGGMKAWEKAGNKPAQ